MIDTRFFPFLIFFLLSMPLKRAFAIAGLVDVGPSVLLGVPHPLNLGVDARFTNALSAGIGMGLFKFETKVDQEDVAINIRNFDFRLRLHPYSGAFFVGAMLGIQNLSGKGSRDVEVGNGVTVPLSAEVNIRSPYITPHLGWMWVWSSGFMLGLELGVQIPFATSSDFGVSVTDPNFGSYLGAAADTNEYREFESDVKSGADKIGSLVFPYITVLRVGWFF